MGKLVYFCAGVSKSSQPITAMQGVLISAATQGKSQQSIAYTLKSFREIRYQHMILDSGGYQIIVAEQAKNLEKSKILKWLTPAHVMTTAAIFNPDIVMALDFPISCISDPKEQNREFEKKIFTNLEWSRECIELHPLICPKSQLFLPVQAYNMKQMDFFFTKLGSTSFDGVSLPTRNASPAQLIQQLLFLYNKGIRKIHLLGTSSFGNIIIMAFMARNYFDWVSFDSSSWLQHSQYGLYLHPQNLLTIRLKNKKKYHEVKCSCPWCQYQDLYDLANTPKTDCFHILLNHNQFVIEKFRQQTFDHSGNFKELENFIKPRVTGKQGREIRKLLESLYILMPRG